MQRFPLLLAVTALGMTACHRADPAPAASASASAAVTEASAGAAPVRAPQPPPADLNAEDLARDLGCATTTGKGSTKGKAACRILSEFATASRWDAKMPSGEGRWIGQAFVVRKGVETREILLLRARRVPTAHVGPTDLPLLVGTGELPADRVAHADKLIRALSEGGSGKKTNLARSYLETFSPTEELGALATQGDSVQLISAEDTFIRRASVKKLVYVKVSGGLQAERGDGVYAEVWSAFW